jgi:carbonic anhydrase/acetyltransferase-like protein (isoleucine patch superfamily)
VICSLDGDTPEFEGDGHFVAPNATLIGKVTLGPGASVWFNAVARGDNDRIRIGRDSNIQDGAVLHTDPGIELIIGDRVTVGHLAMLHGCTIGDNTLIGIGSTVLNRARIGRNSVVGAHTLVTEGKAFPDGVLLTGSPARIVRELEADELAMLQRSADVYVEHGRRYRNHLETVVTWPNGT